MERVFGTLQSRLPIELRLKGVKTIEQANAFLDSYIAEYNSQFALPFNCTNSVFEPQLDRQAVNMALALVSERKIDNGCCAKYLNKFYMPRDENGCKAYFRRGTNATMIKALNGDLYMAVKEKVYEAYEIQDHASYSINFDIQQQQEPQPVSKKYIPPMTHPWKSGVYKKFSAEFVAHNLTFDELSDMQTAIIK